VSSIGDLNEDGITDIVVGREDDGVGSAHILFLNSNGTVKSEQKIGSSTGGFTGELASSDNFGESAASYGIVVPNGTANVVQPGNYTVSEVAIPGYTVSFSGDCDSNGKLTVGLGDTATCTVTNDDNSQSITIISITASDPDGGDAIFSNGDTITVLFSEATNQPFKRTENQLTSDDLLALFTFSDRIGANFTGTWPDRSTLVITIAEIGLDKDPLSAPKLTLTVNEAANLLNAAETSLTFAAESPPLDGISV